RPDAGWLLFEGPAPGSEPFLAPLDRKNAGTLVLWETLDRIVTDGYKPDDFLSLIDDVDAHLAMVFHRLLQGPRAGLRLLLNGNPVAPWDPFMTAHPAKPWASPVAKIHTSCGTVEVQCHVLPHKDRLTAAEFEANAGPAGWTAQQGFYVYRNERLLLAGGWLGLGSPRAWNREESHRLARIRLDIPNTVDAEWKIDVRKSTARPPVPVKPRLTLLAENTRELARRVFASRGAPASRQDKIPIDQAWSVEKLRHGMRYRIAETHPSVAAVLENAGELLPLVKSMLRVIEETVPVQRIWLDTAENKDTPQTGFTGEPSDEVAGVLRTLYVDMIGRRRMSPEGAKRALLHTEPFQNFPALIATLDQGLVAKPNRPQKS
ncbi:MAG: hypothetical protein ACYCSN_20770, partial [Acidobacteriaceae bacterium]